MTFTPEYEKKEVNKYYQHCHPFFEMHYVFRGRCDICLNDTRYRIEENQLILIAPTLYHCVANASADLEKMCVGIAIEKPGPGKGIAQSLYHALIDEPIFVIGEEARNAGVARILKRIQAIVGGLVDAAAVEELKAYSSLLLLRVYRYREKTSGDPASRGGMSVSERKFIIDEFFNRKYFLPNGSAQLARELSVSERQMNRLLLEYYGKGYREKLQEARGAIGYNLLITSRYSISDISEILGYTSPANFSTFIKKQYGRAPSQIRRDSVRERSACGAASTAAGKPK